MGGLFDDDAQHAFLEEQGRVPGHGDRPLDVRLPAPAAGTSEAHDAPAPARDPDAAPGTPGAEELSGHPRRERQRDVVIRLSAPVVRALLAARDARGVTTTDVVLDAVDRAWPQLEEIAPPAPARVSPLPPRTRARRPGGSGGQRVHLRLTPSERATLEEVVDRTTVGSLTDLVERILRHALEVPAADSGG